MAGLGEPRPECTLRCSEGGGEVSALLTQWDFTPPFHEPT